MTSKIESTSLTLIRSIAMGILLSMLFFYAAHVLGKWELENYRPVPETTSTVLLHNTCAVFGDIHTLRPNSDISTMSEGINGTKLGGAFMNFMDGHILSMIVLSLLLGGIVFIIRMKIKKGVIRA
jgi:hypothetical protein